MKLNRKFKYPPCSRSSTDGLRHYDIGKQKLPSVTTILQATMPEEKNGENGLELRRLMI